jgi:hypothetical protein
MESMESSPLPAESRIFLVRGKRVMLNIDLAEIYGVSTRRLNEQVGRNLKRFPADFMFRLTQEEWHELVANCDKFKRLKHYPGSPMAFTEHGAVMLAAVLKSPRAVTASVAIARAFVRLRRLAFGRREFGSRLKELERRVGTHDGDIKELFDALGALIEGPKPSKRIGFNP